MAWDKNDPPEFIGASAKLAAAERMRQAARAEEYNIPAAPASQAIPVTIVFVLAAGLTMLLPEGGMANALAHSLGWIDSLDQALTGIAAQKTAADADVGRLITILARGFMLFLLAGAAPFLAAATAQVLGRNRVNPFVACWGMLIALPLFYLLWGSL